MKTTTAIISGLFAIMVLASAVIIVVADEFAAADPDEEGTVEANEEGLEYISNDTGTIDEETALEENVPYDLEGPYCVMVLNMGPMRMILVFPLNETYANGSSEGLPVNISGILEWFKNWTSGFRDLDPAGCRDRPENRTLHPDRLNWTEPRDGMTNRSYERDGNMTMEGMMDHRHPDPRMGRMRHHVCPTDCIEAEEA
ncbi:MAG: hypothetical protein JXA22_07345 [Candidatus Thermoplasmatota archaeon]|nr:hypothetical protein [Candidatus Thermoplasmatota archaeon]